MQATSAEWRFFLRALNDCEELMASRSGREPLLRTEVQIAADAGAYIQRGESPRAILAALLIGGGES